MKTSLSKGICEAGAPATNDSSHQAVSLNTTRTCKSMGTCKFTHCFHGDYSVNNLDILSIMSEISTTIKFEKEGTWSVNVTTDAFTPTDATASGNRDVFISASVGACEAGCKLAYKLGDTISVCISTADSDVQLSLQSVIANPGGQKLVDNTGNANFITQVKMEGPNKITLETLMIATYYDNHDNNAGYVTISGDAVITYTGRQLLNGCHLQELEVKPFTLKVPLVSGQNTLGVAKPAEVDTSGSIFSAYSFCVLVAAAAGVIVSSHYALSDV